MCNVGIFGLGCTGANIVKQWQQQKKSFSQYHYLDKGNLDMVVLDSDLGKIHTEDYLMTLHYKYDICIFVMGLEKKMESGMEELWYLAGLLRDVDFKIALVCDSEATGGCSISTNKKLIFGNVKGLYLRLAVIHIPDESMQANILWTAIMGILGFFAGSGIINHNLRDLTVHIWSGIYHIGVGRSGDIESSFRKALASTKHSTACLPARKQLLFVTTIRDQQNFMKFYELLQFLNDLLLRKEIELSPEFELSPEMNCLVCEDIDSEYITVLVVR